MRANYEMERFHDGLDLSGEETEVSETAFRFPTCISGRYA